MKELVEGVLRQAGWFPGRSTDVTEALSLLKSRNYDVSDAVEQFLREFTGIAIDFVRNGRSDTVWFDAERAAVLSDPEWVAHYEQRTKQSLVPIGFSNHEHLMLMRSSKGGFYGAFDEFLCALGDGVGELIENLVNQDREPLI